MTDKMNWRRANRERRMWDRGANSVVDEKERLEHDPAARWFKKSELPKPARQQQYKPKSGSGKTIVISGAGDRCPRCGVPMQIREHDGVGDKQLRMPFYYRRWFCCMNKSCNTKQVMPPRYKVMNSRQSSDTSPDNNKPTVMRPDPAGPNERPPWE
jgi:hypothetical protein